MKSRVLGGLLLLALHCVAEEFQSPLICYNCIGYLTGDHEFDNNKYCAEGNFDASKVSVINTTEHQKNSYVCLHVRASAPGFNQGKAVDLRGKVAVDNHPHPDITAMIKEYEQQTGLNMRKMFHLPQKTGKSMKQKNKLPGEPVSSYGDLQYPVGTFIVNYCSTDMCNSSISLYKGTSIFGIILCILLSVSPTLT